MRLTEGKDEMGKRFAIVIGVAAAGVMALGAQPAAAATYDTKLTLTKEGCCPHATLYHGWVMSDRDRDPQWDRANAVRKCERARHVALFKRRPGADRKLGSDLSSISGHYGPIGEWGVEVAQEHPRRDLYARVRREVRDGFVCRADRDNHLEI